MSPPHVTNLLRQRNLTSIPNDQQALLGGVDSWAVDLKGTPHGLAHVPGHVLQSVKEAYMKRRAKDKKPSSKSSSPPASTTNHGEPNKKSPTSTPTKLGPVPFSSSPEREIAWTPSPSRPQPRRVPIAASPVVRETPKARPMAPPPLPPQQPQSPSFDFPSSGGEEEELEMELPQAHIEHLAPVNRAASRVSSLSAHHEVTSTATTNTPPCSQPDGAVIPNTLPENDNPPPGSLDAVSRRPRRMKPIVFSEESPQTVKASTASASFRLPTIKTFPEPGTWNSTSSSSIIPATCRDNTTQSTNGISPNSTAAPPGNITADASERMRTSDQGNPSYERRDHPPGHHGPILVRQQVRKRAQTSTNEHADPFKAFIATYPDYITVHAGTQWHFVSACVCLRLLQREKALREYLYDDFIRAFSGGYVQYVNHVYAAGASQETLAALEWFNCLDGPILFNRMSVTKDNLDHILSAYPEDVARANARVDQVRDKAPNTEQAARLSTGGTADSTHATDANREAETRDRPPVLPKTRTSEARGLRTKPPPQRLPSSSPQQLPQSSPQRLPQSSPQQLPQSSPPQLPQSSPQRLPQSSPPQPPQRLPSPELGSEPIAPPPPPESSVPDPAPMRRVPRLNRYFDRIMSSSQPDGKRKRSAEEEQRVRKRRVTGPGSFISNRVGS